MREMNQFESEDPLLKALRRLAQDSSRVASPAVGAGLATAFRRHHRRRRVRNAALAAVVICGLLSAALLLTRSQKTTPTMVETTPSAVTAPTAPSLTVTATQVNAGTSKVARHDATSAQQSGKTNTLRRRPVAREARQSAAFLPLPSYDPVVAQDDLRVIRVEMPIQDLRLVGAPVGIEVPNRPVLADFVVGHDGTPYAVRVVQ